MASAQFTIYYVLAATATPGQYTINSRYLITVNIFDYSDSAGDDLNVFGDISDDNLGTSASARACYELIGMLGVVVHAA